MSLDEIGCNLSDDHKFPSGAQRSEVAPFYAAIPGESLKRLARRATGAPRGEILEPADSPFTYEGGSRKYGYGNWAQGLPFEDTFNHVIAHLLNWKKRVISGAAPGGDDDLAAAAWGIMLPLMTFEHQYARQYGQRRELERTLSPEAVDAAMAELGPYLLHPLAPEKPVPAPIVPFSPTRCDGRGPKDQVCIKPLNHDGLCTDGIHSGWSKRLMDAPVTTNKLSAATDCGQMTAHGQSGIFRCNLPQGHVGPHRSGDVSWDYGGTARLCEAPCPLRGIPRGTRCAGVKGHLGPHHDKGGLIQWTT